MLLNLFISPSSFCVESLEFSIYSIMSYAYNDNFTSSSNLDNFSFSSLIAVAKTSIIMLKRSAESGHHCLVPDFSRKVFKLFPVNYYAG